MAGDHDKEERPGKRKHAEIRMDRSMDLFWAEHLASTRTPPAAPADLDVDVELVALEIAGVPTATPVEAPPPGEAAGPFIEAQLVNSPATESPPPFIEAVLVAKSPVSEPPPVAVGDWLGDVAAPTPADAPPPVTAATPEWLGEMADQEAATRPASPSGAGTTPDWVNDL